MPPHNLNPIIPNTADTPGSGPPDQGDPPNMADVPDPEPTRWWTYVRETAGGDTQLEIAHKAGIDKYHPTRWKQGWRPAAEFVVRFAEAYNRNPLEALVAADYLTPEQANLHEVRTTDLSEIPDAELLEMFHAELKRRMSL